MIAYSPLKTITWHISYGMRKNGLKISTFWKLIPKLNVTSIFGLYTMEWNSLYNENKIRSFFQKLGTLQQTVTNLIKLIWKNNFIVQIFKHKSYDYIQQRSERCLKCIKYFILTNIHESPCWEVQWEVLRDFRYGALLLKV